MSGNRLPGDTGSVKRQKKETRADVRLDGPLAERFESYRQEEEFSKAGLIREALDEFLPDHDIRWIRPSDPQLAEAYFFLARRQKRVLSVDRAVDLLAETACSQIPKEHIKTEILARLEKAGFVAVKSGKIAVSPLTPLGEAEEGNR
jgi:hypothetical protein